MSSTRSFLLAAFAMVGFLLWQTWQQDYAPKPTPADLAAGTAQTTNPAVAPVPSASADIPEPAGTPTPVAAPTVAEPATPAATLIEVQTDVLHLAIDTRGGAIVR